MGGWSGVAMQNLGVSLWACAEQGRRNARQVALTSRRICPLGAPQLKCSSPEIKCGCSKCAGTLYVFLMVCAGVLYMRYHQPGSGSSALPILAALGGLVLTAIGEPGDQAVSPACVDTSLACGRACPCVRAHAHPDTLLLLLASGVLAVQASAWRSPLLQDGASCSSSSCCLLQPRPPCWRCPFGTPRSASRCAGCRLWFACGFPCFSELSSCLALRITAWQVGADCHGERQIGAACLLLHRSPSFRSRQHAASDSPSCWQRPW